MFQSSANKEILDLTILIYSIVVVAVLSFTIVIFFLAFIKRKNKLLIENLEQQQRFDEELFRAQQEIQDETFKQVGQELHDNVGQLLTLTTMQLNLVKSKADVATKTKMESVSESLKTTLSEVRALSKSLNSDVILHSSFKDILTNEINRINKIGTLSVELLEQGPYKPLNKAQDRLMLFRIVQEFISNALKYSGASTLMVMLSYTPEELLIELKDNGVGFDTETVQRGSGLINMEKRAGFIKASFNLSSQPGKGSKLELCYPFINS